MYLMRTTQELSLLHHPFMQIAELAFLSLPLDCEAGIQVCQSEVIFLLQGGQGTGAEAAFARVPCNCHGTAGEPCDGRLPRGCDGG